MRVLAVAFVFFCFPLIGCQARNIKQDHLIPLGWFGVYEIKGMRQFIDNVSVNDVTVFSSMIVIGYGITPQSVAVVRQEDTGIYGIRYAEEKSGVIKRYFVSMSRDQAMKLSDAFEAVVCGTRYDPLSKEKVERIDGVHEYFVSGQRIGMTLGPSVGSMPYKLEKLADLLIDVAKSGKISAAKDQNILKLRDQIIDESTCL